MKILRSSIMWTKYLPYINQISSRIHLTRMKKCRIKMEQLSKICLCLLKMNSKRLTSRLKNSWAVGKNLMNLPTKNYNKSFKKNKSFIQSLNKVQTHLTQASHHLLLTLGLKMEMKTILVNNNLSTINMIQ